MLSLLALAAVELVACGGGDDEDTTTEAKLSREQRVEQVGNEWAPLFAGRERFCELMTEPACERITCKSIGPRQAANAPPRARENCTPLSSQYRKSFDGATVTNVAITGDRAAARFSNGETVALEKVNVPDPLAEDGDRLGWLIHEVGGNAGAVAFITKVGNAWAALFADDSSAVCGFINGQPLCQRFTGRVGEPPDVGRPSEFQRSFQGATVEHVEVRDAKQIKTKDGTLIGLQNAVAEFSNGELVELIQEKTRQPLFNQLGTWFVDDIPRARRCLRRGSRACRVHFFG